MNILISNNSSPACWKGGGGLNEKRIEMMIGNFMGSSLPNAPSLTVSKLYFWAWAAYNLLTGW